MEELQAAGRTRFLGISNVALDQLEELWAHAVVPPAFVQNRCFASLGWDSAGRAPLRATGGHATADRDDGRRAHARGPRSKPVRAVRGGRAFRGDDRHGLLAAFRLRERLRPALRVEKAGGNRGAKPLQRLELPERETIRTPRLAGRLLLRQRERP